MTVIDKTPVKLKPGQRQKLCQECGRRTKTCYWAKQQGLPLTLPLCDDCYERAVSRLMRGEKGHKELCE